MITMGIYLAERGLIPDVLLRFFIKRFSLSRLLEANNEERKMSVIDGLKTVGQPGNQSFAATRQRNYLDHDEHCDHIIS